MAKKKDIELVADEVIEEVTEEVAEPIVEEVIEEAPVVEEKQDEQFINTQLKMINRLDNPARARRLAERVLRNRKR